MVTWVPYAVLVWAKGAPSFPTVRCCGLDVPREVHVCARLGMAGGAVGFCAASAMLWVFGEDRRNPWVRGAELGTGLTVGSGSTTRSSAPAVTAASVTARDR